MTYAPKPWYRESLIILGNIKCLGDLLEDIHALPKSAEYTKIGQLKKELESDWKIKYNAFNHNYKYLIWC